jgi:hypothetical protein
MYPVTNLHKPPASGHYVDKVGNASQPVYTEIYNRNMGFVDTINMMVNNCSISCRT